MNIEYVNYIVKKVQWCPLESLRFECTAFHLSLCHLHVNESKSVSHSVTKSGHIGRKAKWERQKERKGKNPFSHSAW